MRGPDDRPAAIDWLRIAYSLGWLLATPLIPLYLLWRSRRQPAYRRHWAERWGLHARRTGNEPLLWIHAVSVGETRAAQPLVAALRARHPGARLLLTCMTPTGRDTGRALFGDTVVQAYLPYDYPWAVARFLAAWRPDAGIVMETELWPNLVAAARRRRMPLMLVNARLSERSLDKGRRWGGLIRDALASLDAVAAQTAGDAARLGALGRANVAVTGNLKFDVEPDERLMALGRTWRDGCGGRPVVLAASTRDGEERPVLAAWRERRASLPGPAPLLLVVPRHPQRFDEVAAAVVQQGFALVRRSGAQAVADWASADVVLGDSMGEMFAYYAAADVAVLGGSLLPFGGQNLIEGCAAGVPVVLGPHTYNFEEAAQQAVAAGAALRVADATEAVEAALALLGQPERCRAMASAGTSFAATHRGATARTMAVIESRLALP
jgi:3-deoxy-D-manno-octulosonic-acid transferase